MTDEDLKQAVAALDAMKNLASYLAGGDVPPELAELMSKAGVVMQVAALVATKAPNCTVSPFEFTAREGDERKGLVVVLWRDAKALNVATTIHRALSVAGWEG